MTTGTNLKLTYDEATDSWSYQNVDYEYPSSGTPSWSGYTSPDPDFEFSPPPPTENDQDNSTVCPPGYIYDETLKQCLPDPNYRAPAYAGEPEKGEYEQRQEEESKPQWIGFDAGTPQGRKDMYEHGREQDYFTTDTKKGGAYEFKGPPKAPNLSFLTPAAQFGEDRQYSRYINELNKENNKRIAAGETPILAQAIGFFGLTKAFQDWGNYAIDTAKTIHTDTTTGFQIPDVRTQASGVSEDTDKQLDLLDRNLQVEKLKQEKQKTRQEEIKTSSAIRDSQITETSPGDKQDITSGRDSSGDTYTEVNKDRSSGSRGYTFTPKVSKPSVSQKTKGGVSYGTGRGGTKEAKSSPSKPTMTRPNPHTRSGFSY